MRTEEQRASLKEEAVKDRLDAQATLQKATDLYTAIVKGKHGEVPESVLVKAQCIAVIPGVVTGALLIGGSHGVGVASCKENNTWSVPAFLKLSSISFGAQIGGKSTDLVLFMVNEKAKSALKAGNITLGTDVSVAGGTFDPGLDTSTKEVIAYNNTEGVFAGASISGGVISGDDTGTSAFYGKDLSFASVLAGNAATERNASADRFTALLPR
jgi:SH3 domain-containing YSC84-like protein 1